MTNSTDWPAGVVARYATIGGSTVDIGEFGIYNRRRVSCNGCGRDCDFNGDPCLNGLDMDVREANSLIECRSWAQAHASACRAMPNPNA